MRNFDYGYSPYYRLESDMWGLEDEESVEVSQEVVPVHEHVHITEDVFQPIDPQSNYSNTPAIYAGFAKVLDWGDTASAGRTIKFQITDPENYLVHPFNGLAYAKGRTAVSATGQRLHITINQPGEDHVQSLYTGEGKLNTWSHDPKNGMRVILRLDAGPEGANWHPLTGVQADSQNGEIIYVACWAVGDDETIKQPSTVKKYTSGGSQNPVKQSNTLCNINKDFQRFCHTAMLEHIPADKIVDMPDFQDHPAEFSAETVRIFCNISSRSVLAWDNLQGLNGRQKWNEMMRMYNEWRANQRQIVSWVGSGDF